MALKVTVDLDNKLIVAKPGVTALDAEVDLYSDLKEDWVSNAGGELAFEFPFGTTGGDPIPGGLEVGAYFFLRNDLGWRIRPDEVDHELLIRGNLYPKSDAYPMFVPTVGGYTASVQIERSSLTQTVLGGGIDEAEIAAAVRQELTAELMKMVEVHGRLGLDAVAPVTHTAEQIAFGSIVLGIEEEAGVVTVQRE